MNIAKEMEFIFVAAFIVAVGVTNAFAAPAARTPVAAKAAVATTAPATVVVVGKRLSKAKRAA